MELEFGRTGSGVNWTNCSTGGTLSLWGKTSLEPPPAERPENKLKWRFESFKQSKLFFSAAPNKCFITALQSSYYVRSSAGPR